MKKGMLGGDFGERDAALGVGAGVGGWGECVEVRRRGDCGERD